MQLCKVTIGKKLCKNELHTTPVTPQYRHITVRHQNKAAYQTPQNYRLPKEDDEKNARLKQNNFCLHFGPKGDFGLRLQRKPWTFIKYQVQPYCIRSLWAYSPRTDRQTDRRTDGVFNFLEPLFDNHPFGVRWKFSDKSFSNSSIHGPSYKLTPTSNW